jgi:hypothetical protein
MSVRYPLGAGSNLQDGQAQVRARGTIDQLCSNNAYILAELTFINSLLTSTT